MNTETTIESPAIPPLPPATGSAYPWGVNQDALQHGSLMPDLIRLDNESKIKFCNAWHAMNRHYTVCAQCREYLIEGDGDLCAAGKHLVAKELCYAECRVEFSPNDRTERQPPGEAVACNETSQITNAGRTGKRGGCSLQ